LLRLESWFKLFHSTIVLIEVNHQNRNDMLVIRISSDGRFPLTLAELNKYNIPVPPNGFDSDVNNDVIMKFEDEQEAIDYSYELDSYANTIDNKSVEYRITRAIVQAISEDEFVQSYIQD
jgi:hypothetical protein